MPGLSPNFPIRRPCFIGLKKKGVRFVWGNEHQSAYESLKLAVCEPTVLQIPDFNKKYVLATYASVLAVSAVLHQRVGGELASVSYYIRLLTGTERRYSTYERECLAVIFGCEKCR
jgi:hypothetical protein